MRSVADDLREEQDRKLAELTASERVARALELGRRDRERFRRARTPPLTVTEAKRLLELEHQAGRAPSHCMLEIIG